MTTTGPKNRTPIWECVKLVLAPGLDRPDWQAIRNAIVAVPDRTAVQLGRENDWRGTEDYAPVDWLAGMDDAADAVLWRKHLLADLDALQDEAFDGGLGLNLDTARMALWRGMRKVGVAHDAEPEETRHALHLMAACVLEAGGFECLLDIIPEWATRPL